LEMTAECQRLGVVSNEVQISISEELRLMYSLRMGWVFKLRCITSFLSKRLMPLLPRMQEAFQDIQLMIIADDSSRSVR
ncbi:LysR family transcriptional regulator, partial [Pseudomonas syringae pv. tagetis]